MGSWDGANEEEDGTGWGRDEDDMWDAGWGWDAFMYREEQASEWHWGWGRWHGGDDGMG